MHCICQRACRPNGAGVGGEWVHVHHRSDRQPEENGACCGDEDDERPPCHSLHAGQRHQTCIYIYADLSSQCICSLAPELPFLLLLLIYLRTVYTVLKWST